MTPVSTWAGSTSGEKTIPYVLSRSAAGSVSALLLTQSLGPGLQSWKKRWFALRNKELYYFKAKDHQEAIGSINLHTVYEFAEGPGKGGVQAKPGEETEFRLETDTRAYHLKAESYDGMKEWLSVLRNTQVFGAPIEKSAAMVPLVVEKCVEFLESNGVFTEVGHGGGGTHSGAMEGVRLLPG